MMNITISVETNATARPTPPKVFVRKREAANIYTEKNQVEWKRTFF
jgi:hypothetical protein